MEEMPKRVKQANELFLGVEAKLSEVFSGKSYRHKSLLLKHRKAEPDQALAAGLVRSIYDTVRDNFLGILAKKTKDPSRQNWRMRKTWPSFDPANKPREVGLERTFVKACVDAERSDWWNQVPIASGLINPTAAKRCAIDLVHHRGPEAFDFVELKLGSNTPLYAAVEILQYGFIWLLSRRAFAEPAPGTMLHASDVRLSVLAPDSFYQGVGYREFQAGANEALKQIAADHSVTMTFTFDRLPADFKWPQDDDPAKLRQILDNLYPKCG